MNRDYTAGGIGFQVTQVQQRDASAPRIERAEIEIVEIAISADISAFELTDFAGPHAGENTDQESQ
jgi:hypothetical protein